MKDTEITNENLRWYQNQPIEIQLELFRHYVDMAKILANQFFEDEVKSKAGNTQEKNHQKGNIADGVTIQEV